MAETHQLQILKAAHCNVHLVCESLLLMQVQKFYDAQMFVTVVGLTRETKHGPSVWKELVSTHNLRQIAKRLTPVWFHASKFRKANIDNPDTDTFIIGLTAVHHQMQAVVRDDMSGAKEQIYIDVTMLVECIKRLELGTL